MKKIIVIALIIVFASCAEKLIKKPENLIPKKEMVDILYDLALLTAAKSFNSIELTENNISAMPYIFSKYKIDSLQFAESDLYYASNPIIYENLFTQVQERLNTKKTILEEAKAKKDSLKKDSIKRAIETKAIKIKAAKVKDSLLSTGEK